AQAGKVILITHGLPNQKGHHHVNCQPGAYWIKRIESLGFTCDVAATKRARIITLQDYHSINHFAQSGLVFVKNPVDATSTPPAQGLSCDLKSWRIDWGFRCSLGYQKR